ncbi:MAG TPA: HD domain-containing phosphohydrolase [Anaerolineales bacterium]|nr:HD domain-containing phosphohydrolase [Anaerolineales bacterium]
MLDERLMGEGVRLLVVEDDPAMLIALRDILEGAGYLVSTAVNGRAALEILTDERPALILSDISMPVMDGIELFEAVRKRPSGTAIPFIFLTARGTREDIFAGKSLGVDDYITKPITSQELLAAVHARLQRADEFTMMAQLMAAKDSLRVLANAIEKKRYHVERVNAYAQALAMEWGWDERRRDALEFGAILHDIGQVRIPEAILGKPGPLTDEEWRVMRSHPEEGARMIRDIPYLAPAIPMVLHHHERWDGRGYPMALSGTEIPEEARLLSVADTFDAMTSNRSYRLSLPAETAYEEILNQSGKQFDPEVVAAFRRCWQRSDFRKVLVQAIGMES